MPRRSTLPIVYSCSGCSSAAQLANYLALRLDRSGSAEMSCIAGVGVTCRRSFVSPRRGGLSSRSTAVRSPASGAAWPATA